LQRPFLQQHVQGNIEKTSNGSIKDTLQGYKQALQVITIPFLQPPVKHYPSQTISDLFICQIYNRELLLIQNKPINMDKQDRPSRSRSWSILSITHLLQLTKICSLSPQSSIL